MKWGTAVMLLAAAGLAACGQRSDEKQDAAAGFPQRMAEEHRHDRPDPSPAAVRKTSHTVRTQTVDYGTVKGRDVQGHLAWPAEAEGGLPAVLVLHEWWGLNDNIRAMAEQLAAEGYVALAPDLYLGRVAETPETARGLLEEAMKDPAVMNQNLRQAHAFLKEHVKATRIGTVGWCFGGGLSLRTALLLPEEVDATVIYYGQVSSNPEELGKLRAPILGLFGGADQGIPVEDVRRFEAALKALNVPAEIHVYEGAGHAFANPSGHNYRADAAEDAWSKTLRFLAEHLRAE